MPIDITSAVCGISGVHITPYRPDGTIDPALLIQALFGPVFLLIVLGPQVFDELARIGIHPAIDNVEAYVDLLLHGAALPTAS